MLAIAGIGATVILQRQEAIGHQAQLDLQTVKLEFSEVQSAPYQADASTGGSPKLARGLLSAGKQRIARRLESLESSADPRALADLRAALADNRSKLNRIYGLGVSRAGYRAAEKRTGLIGPRLAKLGGEAAVSEARAVELINNMSGSFGDEAKAAALRAGVGSGAVIVLMLAAFGFYFRRSVRAAQANERILTRTREESLTDSLTGLHNRRALIADLDAGVAALGSAGAEADRELLLILLDLDGFKQYNDTFGHPAGDALLRRLAQRLARSVENCGTAYRMGGDEFCVLARVKPGAADEVERIAVTALADSGKGFTIGCSRGVALIPGEVPDVEQALSLADGRMYAEKTERASASRQSSDVLLRVLTEKSDSLGEHLTGVASLAKSTAARLGLSEFDIERTRMAAELHDVGKTGIPDMILEKPGPLDEDEMTFMKRHTLIGERILRAAPSLAPSAELVRSHHERMDGEGYPDGLAGRHIPLGARIIFVCDAFNAMVFGRPYRDPITVAAALAELRRCAGTQFDPRVVDAVITEIEGDGAPAPPEKQPVPV